MSTSKPAEELIGIFDCEESLLFHDNLENPYARIRVGSHWETWNIKSEQFSGYLERLYHEGGGTYGILTSEALNQVLSLLGARARFDGPMHKLHDRVAWHDGAIYYDLTDAEWRAVKITADGWEIITDPPVLFRRFIHQQAQVAPVKGGDIREFLELINVRTEDDKLLLPIYLAVSCIPDFPHTVLNLLGDYGSCKSTCSRFIVMIVDPSKPLLLTLYKKPDEIVLQLSRRHLAFFDNVSHVTDDISDLLCRAVTGDGYSRRKLYTDYGDIILDYRCCIGLNGINLAVRRSDLLDRSIFIELDRVPEHERKTEKIVMQAFEEARPRILGGIFDTISKAIGIYPTLKLEQTPRMADFAHWGSAVALALGYSQESFLEVYKNNIARQDDEVIESSEVSQAIILFIEKESKWKGSATDLLRQIEKIADANKIDRRSNGWPRSASLLTRHLNSVKPNLNRFGIYFKIRRGGKGKREVEIEKLADVTATNATQSAGSFHEAKDEGGEISDNDKDIPSTPTPRSSFPPKKKSQGGDGDGTKMNIVQGSLDF